MSRTVSYWKLDISGQFHIGSVLERTLSFECVQYGLDIQKGELSHSLLVRMAMAPERRRRVSLLLSMTLILYCVFRFTKDSSCVPTLLRLRIHLSRATISLGRLNAFPRSV